MNLINLLVLVHGLANKPQNYYLSTYARKRKPINCAQYYKQYYMAIGAAWARRPLTLWLNFHSAQHYVTIVLFHYL